MFIALVMIRCNPEEVAQAARTIVTVDGVQEVYSITGEWDLVAMVRVPEWEGINRIVTEHFSVEWDGSAISESKAQSFADALEHSWEVEFEELGWRKPNRSGQWLTLAYVSGGNYAGAVTTVEYCGGDYVPYIVAGPLACSSLWFVFFHILNICIFTVFC